MSFLYPLFFAGIAVIGLPILLHMIRRHTRKRVTFSSLMFLRTTIPRFKNRSKPENLLLLILRCLIICLLAFAFARPFIQKPATETTTASIGKRVVILIDTSASMRRENLWEQATEEAISVLNDLETTDRLCVMSFDKNVNTLAGFEMSSELEPSQRVSVIKDEISKLSPTWFSTNLGNALVTASEAIEDDEINDKMLINERQVILISDLQDGSDFDALHTYEWPEKTDLIVKSVTAKKTTNAAMQFMASSNYITDPDPNEKLRVRITNSSDAMTENFQLSWADYESPDASMQPLSVYVPPGQSVVTELPPGQNDITKRKLLLTGDGQDYDNTLYLAPNLEQEINILYLGNEKPEDSKQMLYYIERAFPKTNNLNFNVYSHTINSELTEKNIQDAQFIIITDTLKSEQIKLLKQNIESGQTILLAMKSSDMASDIAEIAGLSRLDCEEANVKDYAMFGSIEFEHPILKLFSDPRYSNFSKIHFWKYRALDLENAQQARVLAQYDNDDPILIEFPIGQGSLLVLTSGWQPSESELARSSKFVPLFYSILEYNGVLGNKKSQYFVGDPIKMPRKLVSGTEKVQIQKPDGSLVNLDAGQEVFEQTDQPGFYTIESSSENHLIAVNLPLSECRTAPLPEEEIERFGVTFTGSTGTISEQTEKIKAHQNFVELEYQQKYWRWLFIALFVLLLAEICLGGWLTRPSVLTQGEEK
ncbi:MAG: BatA and WFA domain-containing protein [Sedimentisphaerales bacterium]|nr:BatA and WFA domain-containing protein [Sedimentisphaerales bacterium]